MFTNDELTAALRDAAFAIEQSVIASLPGVEVETDRAQASAIA